VTTPGAFSFREITSQGDSWRSAIEAALAQRAPTTALVRAYAAQGIVCIGCGSTYCLAQFVAPYFQAATSFSCRALPSSELLLQTDAVVAPGGAPLVLALSRSGRTSETIMAVEKLRVRGSRAITISCYDDTALSAASDLTLCLPGGREESFAQTRSFAGMLVAAQMLGALTADNAALLADLQRLPSLAEPLIARTMPLAQSLGPNEAFQRITYLGSGALYGLACEAMIKMKEMSLSTAEAFHFMEFRHGPMSLVDDEHLIVALVADSTRDYELAVLRDLKERGGHVVAIAQSDEDLDGLCEAVLPLQAPVSEVARDVLYLPFVQLLAYYRALGRGLNPDRPRNVVMAIELKGAAMV